jgi:hypothetical protein
MTVLPCFVTELRFTCAPYAPMTRNGCGCPLRPGRATQRARRPRSPLQTTIRIAARARCSCSDSSILHVPAVFESSSRMCSKTIERCSKSFEARDFRADKRPRTASAVSREPRGRLNRQGDELRSPALQHRARMGRVRLEAPSPPRNRRRSRNRAARRSAPGWWRSVGRRREMPARAGSSR